MTDNVIPLHPDTDDPVRRARDTIAAVLNRADELPLGMAVFDLWAAFDELVDPTSPPPPPRPVWIEDVAVALHQAHRDLLTAIDRAPTAATALALGRAASGVAVALSEVNAP